MLCDFMFPMFIPFVCCDFVNFEPFFLFGVFGEEAGRGIKVIDIRLCLLVGYRENCKEMRK
jgi:hypothetical protein